MIFLRYVEFVPYCTVLRRSYVWIFAGDRHSTRADTTACSVVSCCCSLFHLGFYLYAEQDWFHFHFLRVIIIFACPARPASFPRDFSFSLRTVSVQSLCLFLAYSLRSSSSVRSHLKFFMKSDLWAVSWLVDLVKVKKTTRETTQQLIIITAEYARIVQQAKKAKNHSRLSTVRNRTVQRLNLNNPNKTP